MLRIERGQGTRYLCTVHGERLARVKAFSEVAGRLKSTAFVIASGPSVARFPMRAYRSHPFIAMNGSILACQQHGITPFFYICDDQSFAKDRAEMALEGLKSAEHVGMSLEVISKLYDLDNTCLNGVSIFLLERANRFVDQPHLSHRAFAWSIRNDPELLSRFSLFSQSINRIGFSKNLDRGYFVARTIPYVALQLCYQLGCPKVMLVGVDMQQGKGRFYEAGSAAAPSALDSTYEKTILPSFKFMAKTVVKDDVFEVYNLSEDSRIPDGVVKKIGLEDLNRLIC